ncbi:hypothetical protein [Natribacillus halophilus]|uniref:YtkA-like n=1 Tax=Natribacillus halophilus TaxID=549003 RepID=A0A1G8MD14_9BACI|nr:hypothetical protein [Natribacillus halophilus]SDI65838.1 hypothetical protein SAMN04488123_104100 [Natribacillus halophilus]
MPSVKVWLAAVLILANVPGGLEIEPLPVMQTEARTDVEQFDVHYEVSDGQVYVETYLPDFSFYANQHHDKDIQGYLMLRVNDDYEEEIHRAAFIVKGLEAGEHTMELEAYDEDDQPLDLKETFAITMYE